MSTEPEPIGDIDSHGHMAYGLFIGVVTLMAALIIMTAIAS